MPTFSAKGETVERDWYVVDATNVPLGRLASEIALRLRGKHKVVYTPHVDTGDYIVVVNAEKIGVTGAKRTGKMYHRHSQYPGGLKSVSLGQILDKTPARAIEHAVKGMLPKGPLGRAMFKKLKVYAGPNHRHTAQQPKSLSF
ncbi:MAG: 50S ribosomal protein L13 [Gammaproteobacteria bacterium]|jgi:large subunit ribosomal protein L13|nr:50S ribosomal protein L13 [Gammaproteobacteria bacterium]